jgi:hypothetical protein
MSQPRAKGIGKHETAAVSVNTATTSGTIPRCVAAERSSSSASRPLQKVRAVTKTPVESRQKTCPGVLL